MTNQSELVFGSMALPPDELGVWSMHGTERISGLFELELTLVAHGDPLDSEDIAAMLEETAYVAFGRERLHRTYGALRAVEKLAVTGATGPTFYRAWLVPRLWCATQTLRSRVFLEQRVPAIARKVLEEQGMTRNQEYLLGLVGTGRHSHKTTKARTGAGSQSYPKRPYVVQYQESDLAFLCRLLEDEGIAFFFVHDPDVGERVLLVDDNGAFPELGPDGMVPYDTRAGISDPSGAVQSISRLEHVVPSRIVLRNHRLSAPRSVLIAEHAVHDGGRGVQVRFGDDFEDVAAGKRIARVRAEEVASGRVVFRGRSTVRGLHAGHRFVLAGHPDAELADVQLLVTSVSHRVVQGGSATEGYHNDFEAVPASAQYRPQRVTPKPRIHGFVPAVIDGTTPGTAASVDDRGRYVVVLPFDTVGAPGGSASTRIPMAQSFAGNAYGIHFPLHIGTTVLIAHLDGDPDRPVIVGAVPDASTTSPVTSDNPATESVIRTRGAIHVEMEDDA
ncbi:MAG: type VI secretion system tip protein VgrG [Deltaproteobacteria bacterium]|nr:type VI secretion system tip protein VgrG [Deltaproteobacteria bacterium]